MYKYYQQYADYIPLMLLALVFSADHEIGGHLKSMGVNIIVMILILLWLLYGHCYTSLCRRDLVLVALVLWIILIHVKKTKFNFFVL